MWKRRPVCHQSRGAAAPRNVRAAAEAASAASLGCLLAARTDRSGLFIFHAWRARVESVRRAFGSAVPCMTAFAASPHPIHSRISHDFPHRPDSVRRPFRLAPAARAGADGRRDDARACRGRLQRRRARQPGRRVVRAGQACRRDRRGAHGDAPPVRRESVRAARRASRRRDCAPRARRDRSAARAVRAAAGRAAAALRARLSRATRRARRRARAGREFHVRRARQKKTSSGCMPRART